MDPVLLIDFGSTYTKLVAVDVDDARLLGTASAYTTIQTDISEGLEYRLYKAARQAGGLEEFWDLGKSKRYPLARIRRLTMASFLGLSGNLPELPCYLRVLGMTSTGQRILKQARPTLPIAIRPGDFQRLGGEALSLFEREAHADDLYGLSLPAPPPCGQDYTRPVVKVGF